MKLDATIILALNRAVERLGGIGNLGKKLEISPSNLSRYLHGKVQTISDSNWLKLKKILCPGSLEEAMQNTPVIEWKELQQDPELVHRNGPLEHLMLRVQGQQMAPLVCDRDLLVVHRQATLKEIPENKIVVAVFNPMQQGALKAVCKRLRKINGNYWFFSDEPGGICFPAEKEKIVWTGVVLRKICEL
ncbi:MAG: S24 family peptidase [Lentisphaerae bacterium]|nr:S24 family peptidase [Lentisphaerota bacterium]